MARAQRDLLGHCLSLSHGVTNENKFCPVWQRIPPRCCQLSAQTHFPNNPPKPTVSMGMGCSKGTVFTSHPIPSYHSPNHSTSAKESGPGGASWPHPGPTPQPALPLSFLPFSASGSCVDPVGLAQLQASLGGYSVGIHFQPIDCTEDLALPLQRLSLHLLFRRPLLFFLFCQWCIWFYSSVSPHYSSIANCLNVCCLFSILSFCFNFLYFFKVKMFCFQLVFLDFLLTIFN